MDTLQKRTNVRFSAKMRGLAARLLAPISPAAAGRQLARLFMTIPRTAIQEQEHRWLEGSSCQLVEAAGHRISLRTWGVEGPEALLVHGWGGRGVQLGAFVEPLRQRGFRVVAWDGPGHGDSPGHTTNLLEFSAVAEAMLARFQPRLLIAHSLGAAAVTLAFARGNVACPAVFIAPVDDSRPFLEATARVLELPEAVVRAARRAVERRVGQRWQSLVASRVAGSMETPLLIVHDEEDRWIPVSQAERLTRAWPDARLETTRGLGHRRILQEPGVVDRAMHFLDYATVGA